jgi:hypothetical protein
VPPTLRGWPDSIEIRGRSISVFYPVIVCRFACLHTRGWSRISWFFRYLIGIGGSLAAPPLPHRRAYGSVPRRFDRVRRSAMPPTEEGRSSRRRRWIGPDPSAYLVRPRRAVGQRLARLQQGLDLGLGPIGQVPLGELRDDAVAEPSSCPCGRGGPDDHCGRERENHQATEGHPGSAGGHRGGSPCERAGRKARLCPSRSGGTILSNRFAVAG